MVAHLIDTVVLFRILAKPILSSKIWPSLARSPLPFPTALR